MNKRHLYLLAGTMTLLALALFLQDTDTAIPTLALLKEGKIEEVHVRQQRLEGRLKEPTPEGRKLFVTTRVEPQFAERLSQSGVKFAGVVESTFWRDMPHILSVVPTGMHRMELVKGQPGVADQT